jgi:hypothetical protein
MSMGKRWNESWAGGSGKPRRRGSYDLTLTSTRPPGLTGSEGAGSEVSSLHSCSPERPGTRETSGSFRLHTRSRSTHRPIDTTNYQVYMCEIYFHNCWYIILANFFRTDYFMLCANQFSNCYFSVSVFCTYLNSIEYSMFWGTKATDKNPGTCMCPCWCVPINFQTACVFWKWHRLLGKKKKLLVSGHPTDPNFNPWPYEIFFIFRKKKLKKNNKIVPRFRSGTKNASTGKK